MTREEAIVRLKGLYGNGYPLQEEALDMSIKALEQEPCEDAISRQAVLDCLTASSLKKFDFILDARDKIKNLPPVNPTKTGHWKAKSFHELFCDNCGFDFDIMRNDFIDKMHYCPNCGVKMVESQERSDEE